MAIKIDFDAAHNPQMPTLVLAKKNGDKLGKLNAVEIEITDAMNDASEMTFKVYRLVNGGQDSLWNEIINFRLVYCVEWNQWFEITVETDEATETVKTVTCTNLGCAELSQIMLYDIEINTEDDIAREDYDKDHPTILYNPSLQKSSLLHRITEKAPHYTVAHVDSTIAEIQRTFSFDDTSIYDAFQDISEEINCLFVFGLNATEDGDIKRTISVYDLESNCHDCGYRGEYTGKCSKCGSSNIDEGYGDDTTIFVTSDELAESLNLSSDTDSIKNCFKLEAGDDLMTATIRNCNPNGSDYIWYIPEDSKRDMSKELVNAIESYDSLYKMYQNEYVYLNDKSDIIAKYNELINKYSAGYIPLTSSDDKGLFSSDDMRLVTQKEIGYNKDIQEIEQPIKGYPSLMNAYYNTIDLGLYLTSELMPTVEMSDTNAEKEASKLTDTNLSPVAVEKIDNISLATANSVVLSMAKIVVDSSKYRVKVHDESSLSGSKPSKTRTWTGCFDLTNYSDEDDTYTSNVVSIIINDDNETFLKQKISKALAKEDPDNTIGISALFNIDVTLDDFKKELKKYCLNRLISFHDACQSCIDILIEQNVNNGESWSNDLSEKLYVPYKDRLNALEAEMQIRENEINLVSGKRNENGDLAEYGLQNYIIDEKNKTQDILNFQNYLQNYDGNGASLWHEFCSFRREDKYSNENFISDGLNNAELFKKANEFIEAANNEIYKSAELQHSISADLRNLLLIKKFSPLVSSFKIGNWLRVLIDDSLYKLRLIEYTIDYDDIDNMSVEFADVVRANSTVKSVKDVIDQASSMATSYGYVQRQAKQGEKSNAVLTGWANNGLDVTNTKIVGGSDNQSQTWDSHGMLFRRYDPITDTYDDDQLKIINSTIAITDDNWNTAKTAIGYFKYTNPETKELESAYGINGEVVIGKLMVGRSLGIYNNNSTLRFDENGFRVLNEDGESVVINPNDEVSIFKITDKNNKAVLSFGTDNNLVVVGNITATGLTLADNVFVETKNISGLSDVALSGKYDDLIGDKSRAGQVLCLTSDNKVSSTDITDTIKTTVNNVLPTVVSDVAISGDYNDLKNKPTLSAVATSGKYSDLSDKPVLADVATSGKYSDLVGKPIFAAVATSAKYTDLKGSNADAGKLLYVDTDGTVTTLTTDDLKTLLGIS